MAPRQRRLVSDEGLRLDGRRRNETRAVQTRIGHLPRVDGSAAFEFGHTQVVASVLGPRECQHRARALHDRCVVACQYEEAVFARQHRRTATSSSRENRELALCIRETFEAVIMTELYPRSEIQICVEVVQADGDALCAAVNAVTLALINAGVPLRCFVTACSAGGLDDKQTVIDMNDVEQQLGGCFLQCAVNPETDEVFMLRMESRVPLDRLEAVLGRATRGCRIVHRQLVAAVRDHSMALLSTRGLLSS